MFHKKKVNKTGICESDIPSHIRYLVNAKAVY